MRRAECIGKHHVELTYDPIRFSAVTCSSFHVFVADSAPGGGVHIHTWSGHYIQSLSHKQLGLQEDDCIWAINCNEEFLIRDPTLQLAVGDYGSESVHSLRACRVSAITEEVALSDHDTQRKYKFPKLIHLNLYT